MCRGRHVVFLRGAVYYGGEGPPFPGPPRGEAHYVFARLERAQEHWSRRDNTVWDHVRGDAVLASNFAKISQNPTMKEHLMSTGTKRLAEASRFDPVWGIGLRADGPEAQNLRRWPGVFRGKVSSTVRDAIRTSEAGLTKPSSSKQFCTSTSPGGINEISPAPPRPMTLARACPCPPSKFSTCFSDASADNSSEVLVVTTGVDPSLALSEHGPCLIGGIITLDQDSSTTKIAVHSGANALMHSGCVAILDTGSPQTFIRCDVWDSMLSVGAASVACERGCAPQSWGRFGESAPLLTCYERPSERPIFSSRLNHAPPCSMGLRGTPLGGAACGVAGPRQLDALNNRFYRSLPPRPSDHRIFCELELYRHAPAGVRAYARNPVASGGGFHVRYDGTVGVTLSDEPQLLAVNLVGSIGSQALTGHYAVSYTHLTLPTICSV